MHPRAFARLPNTPRAAKLIVNAGGASALVEYISEAKGHSRLPGIMALGFVAAFSETLALAVVVSKGVTPLKDASLLSLRTILRRRRRGLLVRLDATLQTTPCSCRE